MGGNIIQAKLMVHESPSVLTFLLDIEHNIHQKHLQHSKTCITESCEPTINIE